VDKERAITIAILIGLFGGLVGALLQALPIVTRRRKKGSGFS
jgi:hypothetical protein